jgi:hypothetical protein
MLERVNAVSTLCFDFLFLYFLKEVGDFIGEIIEACRTYINLVWQGESI